MSKYQTYLSLHEANDAVNASRPLIARLYQMNTLLKKHLKKMQINEHTELSMDDFHQEMTLDSASSVKILLKGIETCLAQLKKQGGKLVEGLKHFHLEVGERGATPLVGNLGE